MVNKGAAKGFGIGLLFGAVAGGVLGLLYAPHSGKITRSLMNEKVDEATHKSKGIVEGARDRAENIMKEAKVKTGMK
ncbi:MAG: YtxH domain-containing protein [Dehalococcoidales bacterium]|nr:YtxH domain-containing protein [Dehalococcoidales bacterium]